MGEDQSRQEPHLYRTNLWFGAVECLEVAKQFSFQVQVVLAALRAYTRVHMKQMPLLSLVIRPTPTKQLLLLLKPHRCFVFLNLLHRPRQHKPFGPIIILDRLVLRRIRWAGIKEAKRTQPRRALAAFAVPHLRVSWRVSWVGGERFSHSSFHNKLAFQVAIHAGSARSPLSSVGRRFHPLFSSR